MKIIRLNIIETIAETEESTATESINFDVAAAQGPRVRYAIVVKGIADTERYTITLQDEGGIVVDMSTTFSVTEEQLANTQDPTITVELTCARIPRGVFRCVRVADLVARPAEPLAS